LNEDSQCNENLMEIFTEKQRKQFFYLYTCKYSTDLGTSSSAVHDSVATVH